MGYTVTSHRRRIAMAVMLLLAASGFVIRKYADERSTLHDIGTLLLVLWLPAVGNLIGFLVGRIPHKAPPATEFTPGSAFAPHLQTLVQASALTPEVLQELSPTERRCTLLVGRQGFTARLAQPLRETFAIAGEQALAIELLRPAIAMPKLPEGTTFHVLAGATGIAKGRVLGT